VAIDAAGNKSFSDQLIVQTPRDTIAPAAPTNLQVDRVTASQVALSWDPASDESAVASYAVFTPSRQIVEWKAGTTRKVIGLPPNKEFTFYAKARDYRGTCRWRAIRSQRGRGRAGHRLRARYADELRAELIPRR
jgi:hypothetical protein